MFLGICIGIVIGLFLAAAYPAPSLAVRSGIINLWRRVADYAQKPPEPPTK